MTGNVRPLDNIRPQSGDDIATEQPGALPVLSSAPTADTLPVDDTNEPVGLVYINQSTEAVEVAVPDGTGGVVTDTVSDLSASISLSTDDVSGLL